MVELSLLIQFWLAKFSYCNNIINIDAFIKWTVYVSIHFVPHVNTMQMQHCPMKQKIITKLVQIPPLHE